VLSLPVCTLLIVFYQLILPLQRIVLMRSFCLQSNALDWLSDGKVNIQTWITHASLDEGAACFEKLITNPGKTAKIISQFS
jgi:threonine dehydrogenase-like Zn-dependent dehydrogenase